jgi:hypothetical protein
MVDNNRKKNLAEIRHGLTDILFRYVRGGTEEKHEHLSGETVFRERLESEISRIHVKGQYQIKISRSAV